MAEIDKNSPNIEQEYRDAGACSPKVSVVEKSYFDL